MQIAVQVKNRKVSFKHGPSKGSSFLVITWSTLWRNKEVNLGSDAWLKTIHPYK